MLAPHPQPPSHRPSSYFQLSPDGWTNAIRSNYSSSGASRSQSAPDSTQAAHSSDRKVRTHSVQPLHPFTSIPLLFFTGLHVHHCFSSPSHPASSSPAPRLPVFHLHTPHFCLSSSSSPTFFTVHLRDKVWRINISTSVYPCSEN